MADRPTLDPALSFFWEAFVSLSPSRAMGMSVGAIPLSEIIAFCHMAAVDGPHERGVLARMVGAMDRAFLKWHQKKK